MVARYKRLSNEAFAAKRADAAAPVKRVLPSPVLKTRKYPGFDIVMDRHDVIDLNWRKYNRDNDDSSTRKYECERPFIRKVIGLPSAVHAHDRFFRNLPNDKQFGEIQSRCRKCDNCRKHRRRLWTARAIDECRMSSRTWFATLTVAPERRFIATVDASLRASRAGHGEWANLDSATKFTYIVKVLGEEITRYWKRLRKSCGGPLRYLLVVEKHEDGFPHFHMVIHEAALRVTKRKLESAWRYGFSQFSLVDGDKAAAYACKYLSKDALTRVRASRHYGRPQSLIRASTELVSKAQRVLHESIPRACPAGPPEE